MVNYYQDGELMDGPGATLGDAELLSGNGGWVLLDIDYPEVAGRGHARKGIFSTATFCLHIMRKQKRNSRNKI